MLFKSQSSRLQRSTSVTCERQEETMGPEPLLTARIGPQAGFSSTKT